MKYRFCVLLAFAFLAAAPRARAAQPPIKPTSRPVSTIEHVLVISVDGARPDVLLLADTPNMHALLRAGSYTMWARTTAVALTLPSHVSMMTGVIPVRHGIHWNEDLPLAKPYYPKVPTLFELAHKAGYTTAIVSAKPKMDTLVKPGTLDWVSIPGDDSVADAGLTMEQTSTKKSVVNDDTVGDRAVEIITQHHPDVMLVHFAGTDTAGHRYGWGSPEQFAAFAQIDRNLGRILTALDDAHLRDHTAILLTADHGGAVRTHGADDPRSRHIPWILTGPGIKQNYDLTRSPNLDVNTYDTFATACYLLGIHTPLGIDGKPITQALDRNELLQAPN